MNYTEVMQGDYSFKNDYGHGGLLSLGTTAPGKGPEQQITTKVFMFFDLCLIWVSGALTYQLIHFNSSMAPKSPTPLFVGEFAGVLLLISTLTVLFGNLRGVYTFPWRSDVGRLLIEDAESVASAAVIAGTCMYLWRIETVSKSLFTITVVLSWILLVMWRMFIEGQPIAGLTEKRNVLIAGCGKNARLLRAHLEQNPQLGFTFKGFLDQRHPNREAGSALNKAEEGILGDIEDLSPIVRTHFIDEIFVALPSDRIILNDIARHALATGINLTVVPDLCDGLAVNRQVEFIGDFPAIPLHKHSTSTLQFLVKRIVDVLASGSLLSLLMPLFVLISALIKLDSPGSVIYRSVRIGKKGKTFICYKFRTMVQNAEALKDSLIHLNERTGILFKISDDPRITRLGRILRKFSLDELPQLWNVLKGDMSLVGPRPCVPSEYKKYSLEHLNRLEVVPGITGLWQVEARQSPSFEKYVSLDRNYVEQWNLWLDCKILFKTVGVVVAGTGQ